MLHRFGLLKQAQHLPVEPLEQVEVHDGPHIESHACHLSPEDALKKDKTKSSYIN